MHKFSLIMVSTWTILSQRLKPKLNLLIVRDISLLNNQWLSSWPLICINRMLEKLSRRLNIPSIWLLYSKGPLSKYWVLTNVMDGFWRSCLIKCVGLFTYQGKEMPWLSNIMISTWPVGHENLSLVLSNPWKQGQGKKDYGNHWTSNMGFMARQFRPRYISALEFGFYLEGSHFGAFGWKWMTSPLTTIGGSFKKT